MNKLEEFISELKLNLNFTIQHDGVRETHDYWIHDQYSVKINEMEFKYYAGIENRIIVDSQKAKWQFMNLDKTQTIRDQATCDHFIRVLEDCTVAIEPKISEVLQSILLDVDVSNIPFEEWCDACGYSKETEWVQDVYTKCTFANERIKKVLTAEQITELRHIFRSLDAY